MFAGLELMLIGMGTVFTFLTLLVFFSAIMSRLVLQISPSEDPINLDHDKLIAVISAAIRAHRNR